MKSALNKLVAGVALAVCSFGAAQAASVASVLFPGSQLLSDNSAESLIDLGAQNGLVEVGDRLRGIFTIETVEKPGNTTRQLGGASGNNELSGIFDVTVASAVQAGPGGPWFFTFAPTPGFAASLGLTTGAMVAFYEDDALEYARVTTANCTTSAIGGDCETNITNGDLFWSVGFTGAGGTVAGAGEGWSAFAVTNDISVIGATPVPGNGGSFNIGLNLLDNFSGKTLQTVSCVFGVGPIEFCGSGSLLGTGGFSTPYDSFDDVNFSINVVPEPSSIALVGLALVGLAASTRRRKA